MEFAPIPAPLYQRIFAVLSQRIRQGEVSPGSQLPTEDALKSEFGVSKATIRHAVDELVARGLVVRRQGSGTFVAERLESEQRAFVGSLTDLITGTPQLPVDRIQVEEQVPFPTQVRSALLMERESGMVYRTRRLLDDVPFVYAVHYISPSIETIVSQQTLAKRGLLTVLKRAGVELDGAEQSVSAQLADADVARELEVELGSAVLFVRRVLRSMNGPVDCLYCWYRGDLYEWQSQLALSWDGTNVVATPI